MRSFRRNLISCFIILIPLLTHAQQDTLKVEFDEIEVRATHSVINASGAPYSVMIASRTPEQMYSNPTLTLDEITYQLPGLHVSDRQNFALGERVTVRGMGWRAAFGVRGIQVLLDGIPLTVADGQSVLNVIDPMFIQRLELLRGPSSTFWGNSSGGVLYLSSDRRYPEDPLYRFSSTVGSYGLRKFDLQYAHDFGKHRINSYGSYFLQDGFRDHSETRIGRLGVNGQINLGSSRQLRYFGAFADMPEAEHPSSLTAQQAADSPTMANPSFEQSDAGKQVRQGQLGATFEQSVPPGLLSLTAYGIVRDLSNPLPFAIIDLMRYAGGVRGTLQSNPATIEWAVGMESKIQNDDRTEFANDAGARGIIQVDQLETVFNNALFATGTWHFGKWSMVGGVRLDWLRFSADGRTNTTAEGDRIFYAFNPSIGLNLKPGEREYYLNFSSGFESPTTTELVNRPGGGNGFNPALSQERVLSIEAGSRGTIPELNLQYDLAIYHYWVDDLILPFQLATDGATFFRNQGATRNRGIEVGLTYRPGNAVRAGASYTLTRATFTDGESENGDRLSGGSLPGIPEHRISGFLEWHPNPILARLSYQYVDGYPVDNLNTVNTEAYHKWDARASVTGWSFSGDATLIPFVEVNNILDTRYNGSVFVNAFGGRYFEPAPGRNWRGGVSVQF